MISLRSAPQKKNSHVTIRLLLTRHRTLTQINNNTKRTWSINFPIPPIPPKENKKYQKKDRERKLNYHKVITTRKKPCSAIGKPGLKKEKQLITSRRSLHQKKLPTDEPTLFN